MILDIGIHLNMTVFDLICQYIDLSGLLGAPMLLYEQTFQDC